jgi:hypothetical protein
MIMLKIAASPYCIASRRGFAKGLLHILLVLLVSRSGGLVLLDVLWLRRMSSGLGHASKGLAACSYAWHTCRTRSSRCLSATI